MAYEQRDNSGSVFKNDRKEKEGHPDWKGSAKIDGVEYWVSGWDKSGQKGPWRSLSFQRKEAKPVAAAPASKPGTVGKIIDDMEGDSIPF